MSRSTRQEEGAAVSSGQVANVEKNFVAKGVDVEYVGDIQDEFHQSVVLLQKLEVLSTRRSEGQITGLWAAPIGWLTVILGPVNRACYLLTFFCTLASKKVSILQVWQSRVPVSRFFCPRSGTK